MRSKRKQIAELVSELRVARAEIQFLKAHEKDITQSVRDAFFDDVTFRVRSETAAERAKNRRREGQLATLILAAKAVDPIYANAPSTPDIPRDRAEVQLRQAVEKAEALEAELADPLEQERLAEEENRRVSHRIGRRVKWPPTAGKI